MFNFFKRNNKRSLPIVYVTYSEDKQNNLVISMIRKDGNKVLGKYMFRNSADDQQIAIGVATIYSIFDKWDTYSNILDKNLNGEKTDKFKYSFTYTNLLHIIPNFGMIWASLINDISFYNAFEKTLQAINLLVSPVVIDTLKYRCIDYLLSRSILVSSSKDYTQVVSVCDDYDQEFLNQLFDVLCYAESWLYLIPLYKTLHFTDIPNLDESNMRM